MTKLLKLSIMADR